MLIERSNGGGYFCGPYDVVLILHNVEAQTYHAAFFEESPFPGQLQGPPANNEVLRLKSKMHHTEGTSSLDVAQEHLTDLANQLSVKPEQIIRTPFPWNGEKGITYLARLENGVVKVA